MVEVKNVSKQYGGKVVLEETSVTIQKAKSPRLSVLTAPAKVRCCLL